MTLGKKITFPGLYFFSRAYPLPSLAHHEVTVLQILFVVLRCLETRSSQFFGLQLPQGNASSDSGLMFLVFVSKNCRDLTWVKYDWKMADYTRIMQKRGLALANWDVWPSVADAWKSKWIAPSWELPDPASLRVGLTTPKASFRKAVAIGVFLLMAKNGRKTMCLWYLVMSLYRLLEFLYSWCILDIFWMGFWNP